MDHGKSMMLMLATMLSEEELIEKLEDSLKEYKIIKTEDNKRAVLAHCQLLLVNHVTKGDMKEATKLGDEMEQHDKRKALFNVSGN